MGDGGWTYERESAAVDSVAVTLLHGSSFCICDGDGEIRPDRVQGVFHRDTRIISGWCLRIDDAPVERLAVMLRAPYHATLLGRTRSGDGGSPLLLQRDRYVGSGMREDLLLRNLSGHQVRCTVTLESGADFADVFAVKESRAPGLPAVAAADGPGRLRLSRRVDGREWSVRVCSQGADVDGRRLVFRPRLPPHGSWECSVQVVPALDGVEEEALYPAGHPLEQAGPALARAAWDRGFPVLSASHEPLVQTLLRSRVDLGSLRIADPARPDQTVMAAGAPWFMALFGRDSLLASLMAIPVDPTLALGTLEVLARYQGTRIDPPSEEEPGRILHEIRHGPDTAIALGGRNVYYGTADATPLFVMLLGELHRWGLAPDRITALLPHADRALDWVLHHGDRDGDGFVEYERATPRGLVNQGWKDSADGINFADGRIAQPPIALCEVQGYVYAAYCARSQLARDAGDLRAARVWAGRARRLRTAFNDRFWLPDKGWYAVGLDRDKRPIDALTSNIGHCLWTGIADRDKAGQVADRLLSPEMFSGWGVRTLATDMGAYHPISYHNGSVWPHDNALVAAGLMRYGFVEQARRVACAVLDGAEAFDGRLPELLCGFDRAEYPVPVPYPASCSPQAWASAAPVQLLRVLLRLEPRLPHGRLHIAPVLPAAFGDLRLDNVPLADRRISVQVTRGQLQLFGVPDGITVVREPVAAPV